MSLSLCVVRSSVIALVRVEVRPGRGAAVGHVAKLVDVETVEALLQAGNLPGDLEGTRTLKMEDVGLLIEMISHILVPLLSAILGSLRTSRTENRYILIHLYIFLTSCVNVSVPFASPTRTQMALRLILKVKNGESGSNRCLEQEQDQRSAVRCAGKMATRGMKEAKEDSVAKWIQ